jgi:Lrp/AsnC family leucine-responsive transcriptional regulator
MDAVDWKICEALQSDGRATSAELGRIAAVPPSTANDRVRRLSEAGVIQGWSVRLDPQAAGLNVLAFVCVLLERPNHTKAFLKAMVALSSVQECHHVTGEWSFLLKIRTTTNAALEQVIVGEIKKIPGVVRTMTVIALSSPKETSAIPLPVEEKA